MSSNYENGEINIRFPKLKDIIHIKKTVAYQ